MRQIVLPCRDGRAITQVPSAGRVTYDITNGDAVGHLLSTRSLAQDNRGSRFTRNTRKIQGAAVMKKDPAETVRTVGRCPSQLWSLLQGLLRLHSLPCHWNLYGTCTDMGATCQQRTGFGSTDQSADLPVYIHLVETHSLDALKVRSSEATARRTERRKDPERMKLKRSAKVQRGEEHVSGPGGGTFLQWKSHGHNPEHPFCFALLLCRSKTKVKGTR